MQDLCDPALADGDWRGVAGRIADLLAGYAGRRGIHGPFWDLPLAHSLTLARAALNNLFPVVGERGRWWVAFGFSSVLGELVQDRRTLLGSLIGFNLAVEIGQLAVVLLLDPIIFAARATPLYQRVFFRVVSVLTVAVASLWFVQRLIG